MKRLRLLLAAATACTAVTAGVVAALPANSATTACVASSAGCGSWFVNSSNAADATAYYIYVQRAAPNEPVIMGAYNGNDAGEDWYDRPVGLVDSLYKAHELGLTAADDKTYGTYMIYQYEYDPYGQFSGFCMTVPGQAAGTKVVLDPCGNPDTTASQDWISPDGNLLPGHVGGPEANLLSVWPADVTAGHYALENPATDGLGTQLDIGEPTGDETQVWDLCGGLGSPCLATQINYVALGDSYSSGEGNPPFEQPDTGCDRSTTWAWPELVSGKLQFSLDLLACAGAKTAALSSSFKEQDPQLVDLRSQSTPTLITVTMGGNDLGFSDVIANCYFLDCGRAISAVEAALDNGFGSHMTAVYEAIKAAAPHARILVVGYPQIVPANIFSAFAHCPWFKTPTQVQKLRNVASQLNAVLASAAAAAGVDYVSTLNAFKDHEMCTGQSDLDPVGIGQGPTSGQAHPNGLGQQAIAAIVENYIVSHNLIPGI